MQWSQDVPLLALLSRADRTGTSDLFRVGRLRRELLWVKEWMRSDRLKLFEFRKKKPQEWNALPLLERAVPLKDTEILVGQRELLQPAVAVAADDETLDGAMRHESKLRAWAEQVKSRQRAAHASQSYHLTTQDLVREPFLEQAHSHWADVGVLIVCSGWCDSVLPCMQIATIVC